LSYDVRDLSLSAARIRINLLVIILREIKMKYKLSPAQKKLDKEIVRLSKITKRKFKLINSTDSYQFIDLKKNDEG